MHTSTDSTQQIDDLTKQTEREKRRRLQQEYKGALEHARMSTSSKSNWHGEPSTTKNSSSSRAPKTGAQLRDNPEEREK